MRKLYILVYTLTKDSSNFNKITLKSQIHSFKFSDLIYRRREISKEM